MAINNLEQIKGLLKFENENDFYFVQVLQRKKDHKPGQIVGTNNNHRLVKAYYIYSLEQLDYQFPEMKAIADVLNARIYIHLNRRNAFKMALEYLEDVAHNINSGHATTLHKGYSSTCGKHHSSVDKTWIVDVDKGQADLNELVCFISSLEPIGHEKLIAEIPTKNGVHLISRAFNSQKFSEKYPEICLHKNNPTILYIP